MKKITDAIQSIEQNLDAPLTVEDVAAEAGFSSFHFQRLFSRCLGLPMGFYILQRRLMKAAFALGTTDARIIEIAQEAGYKSQEAFTRAFRRAFDTTPARYRKEKRKPTLRLLPALDKNRVSHLHRHPEIKEPRLADQEAMSFIGLTQKIDRQNATPAIEALWQDLSSRLKTQTFDQSIAPSFYGILHEGATAPDGPAYDQFHYSAAIAVPPTTVPPEGWDKIDIPPCLYAIFSHRGGTRDLPLTNAYIWGVWLAQSSFRIAPSPDLEVYPPHFKNAPDDILEIWIPLKRP